MKKIIMSVLVTAVAINVSAQSKPITLKMLFSGELGVLQMMPGFTTYIKPYLPVSVSSVPLPENPMKIKPKSYVLPNDMTVAEVIERYPIVGLDLSSPGYIIKNYYDGNLSEIILKTETLNVVFVSYEKDGQTKFYIVDIFYSHEIKKWVINAHPMDKQFLFKKDVTILTP